MSFAVILAAMLISIVVVRTFAATPSYTEVHVLAGSENQPLFDDQRVKDLFAKHGLRLLLDYQGSRQMASRPDLCHFDLALPSSAPAADKIANICHTQASYPAFSSPMVVITFADIIPLLRQENIVKWDPLDRVWEFDVSHYLAVVKQGRRWDQIGGNTSYPSPNSMLVTTTDPRYSNSAAMYVAVMSSVLNGGLVTRQDEIANVAPVISQELFLNQGYTQNTSQLPFEDYLGSLGESEAPMLWAYEAQFVEIALNHPDLLVNRHMVMLYPSPTAVADHTVVPMTPLGDRVGQLLSGHDDDTALVRLEVEHGFRTHDPQDTFTTIMAARRIPAPTKLVLARLPTYDNLESLLTEIQEAYGR